MTTLQPAITVPSRRGNWILTPRSAIAAGLHGLIERSPETRLIECIGNPLAMQCLRKVLVRATGGASSIPLSDNDVLTRIKSLLRGGSPTYVILSGQSGSSAAPTPVLNGTATAVRPDLSITDEEYRSIEAGDIRAFWRSRLTKLDPIARIGFGLWCASAREYREAIENGDPAYWNHHGFAYWEGMVRSTVVNLSVGLNKAGFRGTMRQEREKIREVGKEVARQHAKYVREDYREHYGNEKGLLSPRQIAHYHHAAFKRFGVEPDTYGGTWLKAVPDDVEFRIYGALYCHDCDSDEGYPGPGAER